MASINLITLERPTADEAPLQAELNEALVRDLLLRTKSSGAGLLGATFLLWLIIRPLTGGVVFALLLGMVGVTLFRVAGAIWSERRPRERFRHMRVFAWFAAANTLIGMCLGAIILISFPHLSPLAVAMCCVCIVAVNSGAMVSLAGSPLVYLLYVASSMAALNFVAFAHPIRGLEHVFQVSQVIYSPALLILMRSVHRSLRKHILLRLQLVSSLGELRDTQAKLVEASRQAGRSDVATTVLHNVGNVLNSVNVSAALVADIIANLKTASLSKVAAMLIEHRDDLGRFFRDDRRGQKLPEYFTQLHGTLEHGKGAAVTELQSLTRNIDHINVIVSSQQAHVRAGGTVETFDVHGLLDDALKFSVVSHNQDAIAIIRRFDALPPVTLDRHKALQILMNLLANARDALKTMQAGERRITVRARRGAHGDLEIAVEDNGCGVDPRNLEMIFRLGFTTKPDGHGLGLHYSANAARELKGTLTAHSAGLGRGASFLLVLPLSPPVLLPPHLP